MTPQKNGTPQKNPREMKTGEVAEQARRAGIKDIEQMNKGQMLQAMSQSKPQQAKAGRGNGRGRSR